MKVRLYQILLVAFLFQLSCTPGKEISFEVLQAAEFEFPDRTDSLLVLNLAYYPWVDTLSFNILNRVEKPEQNIIDTFIIASIFNGFFSILDHSAMKKLTENQYYEIRGETKENFLKPLSIESVNYLCEEFSTTQIVALEYYGLAFNYEYIESFDEYYAILNFERLLGWRIYRKNEGMIFEDFKKDTVIWEGIGPNFDLAHQELPSLTDAIRDAFWLGGESFAKKISPYWTEVIRPYYKLNKSPNLDGSLDEEFLKLLTTNNNKQLAFKAYFNLAVVYEQKADYDRAIAALGKASELKPNREILNSYKLKLIDGAQKNGKVLEQISK